MAKLTNEEKIDLIKENMEFDYNFCKKFNYGQKYIDGIIEDYKKFVKEPITQYRINKYYHKYCTLKGLMDR